MPYNSDCAVGNVNVGFSGMVNETLAGPLSPEGFDSRYFQGITSCTVATLLVTINVRFNGTTILTISAGKDAVAGFSFRVSYLTLPGQTNCSFSTAEQPPYYSTCRFGTMDPSAFAAANWTAGLNLYQAIPSASAATVPQPQILTSIASQLDTIAAKHQQNIYRNIAADLGVASGVQSAGQFLTAYKLLAQAYASFGLPTSLQTNDALRAALYGSQSIEDAPAVQADFTAYSTSSISDTTDNKLTDEVTLLNSQASSFSTALSAVFSEIQQSQTPDSLQQIDTTLQDLQALLTLKNASALAQCDYQLSTPVLLVNPVGAATGVGVQVEPGCTWNTSTSSNSWVSISSGQGSGNGTVSLSFAPNTSGTTRATIVIVGEQILRILQGAAAPGSVPPSAPILTSPTNGAPGVSVAPTLTWSVSNFATSYGVYLGTNNPPALVATVNGTSYPPQSLSPGTVYYWEVVAINAAGSTSSALGSFTTQAVPPEAPILTAPAAGTTGLSFTPTLSWTASPGSTSYLVYLGTSSSPPQVATVSGTSFSPPSLAASTTYYWHVAASNSAGISDSGTSSFTTQAAGPSTPTLSFPANGATGVPLTANCTWNVVANANSYTVYLGTTSSPPAVATVSTTSYAPPALTPGTTYYWVVKAINANGSSSSETWSFTTAAAPAAPVLNTPANGASSISLNPTLTWTGPPNMASYGVYLSTTTPPSFVANASSPSYQATALTPGTTYYWSVSNAGTGAMSPIWSFTTQATAGAAVVAVENASGAVGSNIDVKIDLTAGSGAPVAVSGVLTFDQQALSFVSARAGDSLNAAGKYLSTSASAGHLQFAVVGINGNTIANGPFLIATFTLNSNFPTNGQTTVTAANTELADVQGQPLPVTGGSGTVTAAVNRCDLDQSGNVTVGDVQIAINLLLSNAPDPWGQPITIGSVQSIINAALGLGCNR